MDIVEELKSKNLLEYVEKTTGQKTFRKSNEAYHLKKCPVCKSGDHFYINPVKNIFNTWENCCLNENGKYGGSIIDFQIHYFGQDKDKAIHELCKEFKIGWKETETMRTETKEVKPVQEKPTKTLDSIDLTSVINNYYNNNSIDYKYIVNRLLKNYEYSEDNIIQSNYDKIISNYKIIITSLKNLFTGSDLEQKYKNNNKNMCIVPIWDNGKVISLYVRSIESKEFYNISGIKQYPGNLDYLKNNERLLFITESVFDSFSLECLGYKSIFLNSIVGKNKFIDFIKQNIETCKNTKFVLAMDNDKAGLNANLELKELLSDLNLKNFTLIVPNEVGKDINDYYLNDLDGLKENIKNIFTPDCVNKYMSKWLKNIENNKNTKVVKTGFDSLDKKLNGGLYPGLYVLGAISSLGKTALTLQIADNIAELGNHVLFFSLEMPQDELISRSISRHMFLLDNDKCKDVGTIRVLNKLVDNCNNVFNDAVKLYTQKISNNLTLVQGDFDMKVNYIVDYVNNFVSNTGIKPVVFIDYLQIIKSGLEKSHTEKQGIDDIVVKLKMLSRDLNIPVFVVSSLNRASYDIPVNFECFKESGGIEYTSDFVLGLQLSALDSNDTPKDRDKKKAYLNAMKNKIPREITLVILKNRNGKSFTKQKFNFYPKNNLFVEGDMLCL